jgi:signal transduction histidine kinase
MLPLAIVAGLVVGVVLPWSAQRLLVGERQSEAQLWAYQLAERMGRAATERPRLWAYDENQLARIAAPVVEAPVDGAVDLDLPDAHGAWRAGRADLPDAVSAWAAVRRDGQNIGRVRVRLDAATALRTARQLWAAAAALGLLLALALFRVPLAAVRRGDLTNAALYDALEQANVRLEARVAARTAELEQRRRELQALGSRLVMVQEEARKRLSRDLHDDLGQVLTGLRLQLTAAHGALVPQEAVEANTARAASLIEAGLRSVDEGVERVRRLAHDLRSPSLEGLGARVALAEHAEQFTAQAGLKLDLDAGAEEPPDAVGDVLFRIAQEALTNIARHARAQHVRVRMGPADDGWRLIVDDDGVGLPPGREGAGLGLMGASERAAQAGGYLDLEPSPEGGLRVLAWLPPNG